MIIEIPDGPESEMVELLVKKTCLGSPEELVRLGYHFVAYLMTQKAKGNVLGISGPEGFRPLVAPWEVQDHPNPENPFTPSDS